MELAKPKQKKKKLQPKPTMYGTPDDEDEISLIDIDFPRLSLEDRTSSSQESWVSPSPILKDDEEDGFAAKIAQISTSPPDERLMKELADAKQELRSSHEVSPVAPTAPVIEEPSPPVLVTASCPVIVVERPAPPLVVYPNLEHIRQQEATTSTAAVIKDLIKVKPFSRTQLEELFSNPQLKAAIEFQREFIEQELHGGETGDGTPLRHVLAELLAKYSKSRQSLKINLNDIRELKRFCEGQYSRLWSIKKDRVTGSGACSDGNMCYADQIYETATLNENVLQELSSKLKDLMNLSCSSFSKNAYSAEICKEMIEEKIREILSADEEFLKVTSDYPSNLQRSKAGLEKLNELRMAVSILFSFLRKPIPDKTFTNDLKAWLTKLVALQLRVGAWQDQMFLLFHVLRCPIEIASWAATFLQPPPPGTDLNSFAVHHSMTILAVLLLPIEKRSEFLGKVTKDLVDPVDDDLWVLVDSDGEDDVTGDCSSIKENDLVALLNQLPFEQLFACLTGAVHKSDGDYHIENAKLQPTGLLKAIAFATAFVELLGQGLVTYSTDRYRQFAKRLARLVKHIILYVSELKQMMAVGGGSASVADRMIFSRLQMEYDMLIIRACGYIYNSASVGTWQYLAGLPFGQLSPAATFRLYYHFHVGFSGGEEEAGEVDYVERITSPSFVDTFCANAERIPSEDLYYLLQVFSSIALARPSEEWQLISSVTVGLYRIGFVNDLTRDTCYKTVKDAIGNIATLHPSIISLIVARLKEDIGHVNASISYLMKALPLELWSPTMDDFEILAAWLLNHPFESTESTTARIVFNRLNWNFDGSGVTLFLPHDIHVRMACLICQVAGKHVPESIGGSGISVTALVKNQTSRVQFSNWCWNMASQLRLHAMDQGPVFVQSVLTAPGEVLPRIPDLERTEAIYQGVAELRPLAFYLSVLVSTLGHSVPLICHTGFEHMKLLLADARHTVVIRCLQLVAPLFVECPDSLSACEKFRFILDTLIGDRNYAKATKDFVVVSGPRQVVELLGNMIQAQLINYVQFGMATPTPLVRLWLLCLTAAPGWHRDTNYVHLVDLVVRVAYQFPDAWYATREHLRGCLQSASDDIKATPSFGLMNFLGASTPAFDVLMQPSSDAVWLSLLLLELEHEIFERDSRLWQEFVRQLAGSEAKASLDSVLKRTAVLVGRPAFSSSALVLFKVLNLILGTDVTHPVMPLLGQLFFSLYLTRIAPSGPDEARFMSVFGVADKFYESNVNLMKKLKRRLLSVEEHHAEASLKKQKQTDEALGQYHNACSRLFKSFVFWLEETQMNKMTARSISLPPQYELGKLRLIFQSNLEHWREYLNFEAIRDRQRTEANNWLKFIFRLPSSTTLPNSLSFLNGAGLTDCPKTNLQARLRSYDAPHPAPPLHDIRQSPPLKSVPLNRDVIRKYLRLFQHMDDHAKKFVLTLNEHKKLDSLYAEVVRALYVTETRFVTKRVSCGRECAGAASIRLEFRQFKTNTNLQHVLRENRDMHEALLGRELASVESYAVMAVVQLLINTRRLVEAYRREANAELQATGVMLFYETIKWMREATTACPTTQEAFGAVISQLGPFMQASHDVEGANLIAIAVQRPELVKLLAGLFTPTASPAPHFLDMYQRVVDLHRRHQDVATLHTLLAKFEIAAWLDRFRPKFADINALIKQILAGLEAWDQPNSGTIQRLLRSHLIAIFEHEFPEHYGEVLQLVLVSCSAGAIRQKALLDLLNALFIRVGLPLLDPTSAAGAARLKDDLRNFATKQNVLAYKMAVDTALLLTHHFRSERLQHGLHGLYPKHADFCETLAALLGAIAHCMVAAAIQTYPAALADDLIAMFWPVLLEMFNPWLVPYFLSSMRNSMPAAWVQQMANNQVLLPCGEKHTKSAEPFLRVFLYSLLYVLEMLPGSGQILGLIFAWWEQHFAAIVVSRHVLVPLHSQLVQLPWERFRPQPPAVDAFTRILQQFLPECHSFVGHLFLRVAWTPWLQQSLAAWDLATRPRLLSSLLAVFVKLSFEPRVRENLKAAPLLCEAASYPWHLVEYAGVESVVDWFILSAEPSVVLQLSGAENQAVDDAAMALIRVAAAMEPGVSEAAYAGQRAQQQAKRALYVRMVARLLRNCTTKYQQLMQSAQGVRSFNAATARVLDLIETVMRSQTGATELETNLLVAEIIAPLPAQSELPARLFVDALSAWLQSAPANSLVLPSILHQLGACRSFSHNLCLLLEATLAAYLRHSDSSTEALISPSWQRVVQATIPLPLLDASNLIANNLLLCLHTTSCHRLGGARNAGEKVTFLQCIFQNLDGYKTTESTEAKWFLMVGMILTVGARALPGSRQLLLSLSKDLLAKATQSDGGILGAIGLKRDGISNRKRILCRCLACIGLSLCGDESSSSSNGNGADSSRRSHAEYKTALDDLKLAISSKKFADLRTPTLEVIALLDSQEATEDAGPVPNVADVIRRFYKEAGFLDSAEHVWL